MTSSKLRFLGTSAAEPAAAAAAPKAPVVPDAPAARRADVTSSASDGTAAEARMSSDRRITRWLSAVLHWYKKCHAARAAQHYRT